jgi:hypothetical protein
MDIVTATKIIQDQATVNGNSFEDELWNISNNLKSCSQEVYDAWTELHIIVNEYFRRSADRSRIQRLAREVKGFDANQQAYFNSL